MRAHGSLVRMLVAICLTSAVIASSPTAAQDQDQDKAEEFDAKMREGESLLARRPFEDALRRFKDANALQGKKSARAQIAMARAYQGLQAYKSAADACTEALKHAGADPVLSAEARNSRGLALFSLSEKADDKRLKQAEEDFRAVLDTSDRFPIARYNLGVALLKQGRDDEGISELKTFIDASPRSPEVASAQRYVENPRRARERFAPDFSITTLEGEHITLDDLKGRVVLIDFWATWCGPCVEATPGLARMQKKFKDQPFTIIGISADREREAWRAFVEKHKLQWAHHLDDRRALANRFGVSGYPTYVLLDHEGIVRFTRLGWNPQVDGEIEHQARKLLKALTAEK